MFLRKLDIFGSRRSQQSEWLQHEELYITLSNQIESSHIKVLQRVRNMWRIYLDKVILMADGVKQRGKTVPILGTNHGCLDSQNTIKVCVKNILLSVEELTNCENGVQVMIAKASTLRETLPRFIHFGQFIGRVTHLSM